MLSILVIGNNSTVEYARRIFSGISCDIRFILAPPDLDPMQFTSTGAYDLVLSEYPPGGPGLERSGVHKEGEEPLPALVVWPVSTTTTRRPADETAADVINVPGTSGKTRDLFTQLGSRISQVLEKSVETEEAKKTQSRLCNILASINTGVFIVDMAKKTILHVNEYALQRMQVPKEDVIGKDYHEYLDITSQTNHFEALPEEGVLQSEGMIRGKDGLTVPVILNVTPARLSSGTHLLITFLDNSSQKQAEKALRESETTYERLVETSPDAIILTDIHGNILRANSNAHVFFGFENEDEIRGKRLSDLFQPGYTTPGESFAGRVMQEGVLREELTATSRSGHHFPVEISSSVIHDTEGTPYSLIHIIRDIFDRKMAEEALRASEERYRNIVEDQNELICRFKPDGTHVFVNGAYCRYFNMEKDKIAGSRFIPDIHPGDREALRTHFASLTRENPVALIDQRIIMPDGSVRWQRWSDRAIFDESGTLVEYQSVGRDITMIKNERRES